MMLREIGKDRARRAMMWIAPTAPMVIAEMGHVAKEIFARLLAHRDARATFKGEGHLANLTRAYQPEPQDVAFLISVARMKRRKIALSRVARLSREQAATIQLAPAALSPARFLRLWMMMAFVGQIKLVAEQGLAVKWFRVTLYF